VRIKPVAIAVLLGALAGCTAGGTVPAASMSVSIANGTTLSVTLVVNQVPIETVQPGDDAERSALDA